MKIAWIVVSYGDVVGALGVAAQVVSQDSQSEVFIVCNGPGDYLEAESADVPHRDRVHLVNSQHNPGYIGALREVIHSIPKDEVIVLANADISLESDALENLRTALATYSDAAMLAPCIIGASGANQNPHLLAPPRKHKLWALRLLHRFAVLADILNLRQRGHSAKSAPVNGTNSRIYAGHGSCLIFTPLFRNSGGSFEYPVFLFGEELWFGSEVRRIGATVRYVPAVRLYHSEHAATGTRRRGLVAASKYAALAYWTDNYGRLNL